MDVKDFEVIVINTPLPDEFGHELGTDAVQKTDAGVILLAKTGTAEQISDKLQEFGVLVLGKPFTAPQTKVNDSSASQAGSSWSRQAAESSWLTSTTAFPARREASASTSRSRSSRTRCRSRTCLRSSLRSIQSPSAWGQRPHIRFS